jgi:bifunctional ADP-heptose synthase (sugar kinase/adenylyltransferase)
MNLDAVKDYRVLIVGDAIRDRYVFVKPLGKSMKESVISVSHDREEEYLGGVWAAASHLTNICAKVDVMHGPKVMVNTRFVEESGNRKLFTLHSHSEEAGSWDLDIRDYDVVIVADFGHGTMTKELIERVTREARFLAVNAQTNSSNYGFNLITKYPRADFVVVDELEARLAAQDRDSDIEDVIIKLGHRRVVVTLGSRGAVGFDGAFYREAAQASHAIDSMGAGDAFLVVSSVFAKAMCSMKDVVSIGNAAGAAKVGVVGHRRAINREDLEAHGPRH